MKARAKQRTFFNKQVEPNICVLDPISFSPDELDFLVTRGGDRHAEISLLEPVRGRRHLRIADPARPALTARLRTHLHTLDDGGDLLRADVIESAQEVVGRPST